MYDKGMSSLSMYLYGQELILCHLVHSQTQPQSLSTSLTGLGHHCMLQRVLGKLDLKIIIHVIKRTVNTRTKT